MRPAVSTLELVASSDSPRKKPLMVVFTPTHDPSWLAQTYESLKAQSYAHWRWIVFVNHKDGDRDRISAVLKNVSDLTGGDERVKSHASWDMRVVGVGQAKLEAIRFAEVAFAMQDSDIFVELDHDDLLLPNALSELARAFDDPGIGFAYSDFIDFDPDALSTQGEVTYRHPSVRPGWIANGFRFYSHKIQNLPKLGVKGGTYEVASAFAPSALALSLVYYAPNHVRAWRKSAYWAAGGHSPAYEVCDDHELLCRTYLTTKMKHVPLPLYLYRVSGKNTWAKDVGKIRSLTYDVRAKYLEKLVLRECELLGLPAFDLGGGISPREGFVPVDLDLSELKNYPGLAGLAADLNNPWPFEDGSVGAFRASDLLEHLTDKKHVMSEIWRCLRPGGWLLSLTPSTDGRGAFMDPTHVSYWNELSFWYWTRKEQAKYIRNDKVRFQEVELKTVMPSEWHKTNNIPYVMANLVALKPGYEGPGEKRI